jgi:hypothetical protein
MNFPAGNRQEYRKLPDGQAVLEMLRREELELPPVRLALLNPSAALLNRDDGMDGLLRAQWGGVDALYVFTYKAASTPRAQEAAIARVRADTYHRLGTQPLVIVPHLGEEALRELDRTGTSGIDLCGNGLLIAENFRFWRSGQPNRYKDARPIRQPFVGDSSIFAKCFLLRDHFPSLLELGRFAKDRTFGTYPALRAEGLTQGTASKVVQSLVDELIVRKVGSELILQDRKRLLVLLQRGYRRTEPSTVVGATLLSPEHVWDALKEERTFGSLRAVATGLSSAGHYKALSGGGRLQLYVSDINYATTRLALRTGKAFANIELHEDRKHAVYFDAREEGAMLWASPIQTWLELATGGPREQEAATAIEQMLLEYHEDSGG